MTNLLKEYNCNSLNDVINNITSFKNNGDTLGAYILFKETRDYLYNTRNANKNYNDDIKKLLAAY